MAASSGKCEQSALVDRLRAIYRPDPVPYLHLVDGGAYPTVDQILHLAELAWSAGYPELHVLAWEHPWDARVRIEHAGAASAVPIRLVILPAELPNWRGRKPPTFVEAGALTARRVVHADGSEDVELTRFVPGLPVFPRPATPELTRRAATAGFDFIDYWAVDFDFRADAPFHHHWRWGRSPRDRRLRLRSEARRGAGRSGRHIGVKVVDVFGYETLTLIDLVGA